MNSRISRRTKVNGGKGVKNGNHSDFNAHHVFGDYRVNPIKDEQRNSNHANLVNLVKKKGYPHAGSRPMRRLKALSR